jgi:protein-S-isoprenylcysteine O-methyltransferase Ste14
MFMSNWPNQRGGVNAEEVDSPGVIAFPPLLFLAAVVSGLALHFVASDRIGHRAICIPLGIVLALVSGTIATSARATMTKAGTNVRPDRPALAIVRDGPYRYTRNPMYLSLCILQVGLGFLVGGWTIIACVVPLALVLHFGVILREERYLERKFGEIYTQYRNGVRRWI